MTPLRYTCIVETIRAACYCIGQLAAKALTGNGTMFGRQRPIRLSQAQAALNIMALKDAEASSVLFDQQQG
jgi:hypothetical protein